jgi:hypothetical protein
VLAGLAEAEIRQHRFQRSKNVLAPPLHDFRTWL